jgi:large subunit ribosomal protein L4
MQVSKLTSNKKESALLDVSDKLFGCKFNETLVHQVANSYFCNSHTGTKAQKTRADVRGGGRKPWRQKGMGRARFGSTRNPIWRSGGVTFAAKPNRVVQKVNKRMFQSAIACIFSQLVREKRLFAIEPITLEAPKTKQMHKWLAESGLKGYILFILKEANETFALAIRNIPNVSVFDVDHINPLHLISFDYVLIEEGAINTLQERIG